MKIVFLTRRFYPEIGGVEKHVLEISKELLVRGNSVLVISESGPKIKNTKSKNYQSSGQSDTHSINSKQPVKSSYFDVFVPKKINILRLNFGKVGRLKKFRIWIQILKLHKTFLSADVIHCHDVFFWYLPLKFLFPNKKIFTTFHGYETKFPPKASAKIIRKLSEKLSDGNICVGKYIERWYGTHADYITYGGVEEQKVNKKKPKNKNKKLKILFLGRFDKDNGADVYVKALEVLRTRGVKFEFVVCGDGELRRQALRYGKVLGFKKNVGKYIESADIIFSSSYLSILESLSYGKKVFSVYQDDLKRDYLTKSPFKKFINIAGSSTELVNQLSSKTTFDSKTAIRFAQRNTWRRVTNIYIKLWGKDTAFNRCINVLQSYLPLLLILAISSAFFLTNLGGQGYALDEASTVGVAKTILMNGYPTAWDGTNLLTDAGGKDFTLINGVYVWTWHPWLQFYILAPFIQIFGLNNLYWERFPYAVFGILSVLVFFQLGREIFKSRAISFLISLNLIFLLPFFIFVRHIRYYSPAAFFSLCLFWVFVRLYKKKLNNFVYTTFFAAGTLLFFTNYAVWGSSILPIFLLAILKRDYKIIFLTLFQGIVAVIYFYFFSPFAGSVQDAYPDQSLFIYPFIKHVVYLNNNVLAAILIPVAIFCAYKLRKLKLLLLVFMWVVFKLFIDSLILDVQGKVLVEIFPVLILILGFIYTYVSKISKPLLILLFLTIILTNYLNIVPKMILGRSFETKTNIYPYVLELTRKYENAFPLIGEMLKKDYKKGDLFFSNNYSWSIYDYADIPSVSSVCANKDLVGPESITNRDKIKWYIFFMFDTRLKYDLNNYPCFGKKWNEKMLSEYSSYKLSISGLYNVNDVDVENRQFPPIPLQEGQIVIYEKK